MPASLNLALPDADASTADSASASAAPDSFNQQLDRHTRWRRDSLLRLERAAQWLASHELQDDNVRNRLRQLQQPLRRDQLLVAFVAEFSRGKSELINALFFADYGRRIMPASAGRTTMCPTELGHDPTLPPCLRLLPIDSRLQARALMEWRQMPQCWVQVALDVEDPAQLALAFAQVAEVQYVTPEVAQTLGFDAQVAQAAPPDQPGLVEVPRWRHALVNLAHPLLTQGLVILDTPGLNAIGAEPELTVNLIGQAHAVVFVLGADTGVTQSDLAIWQQHLATGADAAGARLVVLNKIDTLWDALSTPAQVQQQIERQCAGAAALLGLPAAQVVAVSAHKGLLAKVRHDAALLQASCLPQLETLLAEQVLARRQTLLRQAIAKGLLELRSSVAQLLHSRRREGTEQLHELLSLRGKNANAIRHMRQRIEQERTEFSQSGARVHAVRSVHLKLLAEAYERLGNDQIKAEMVQLADALRGSGLRFGITRIYTDTFARLRLALQQAQTAVVESGALLQDNFRQLNTDYGFSLQCADTPTLAQSQQELTEMERSHLKFIGLTQTLKLAQPAYAERLVRALAARLRVIFETASSQLESWSQAASAQLDSELRERRNSFSRRADAVRRIEQAAGSLEQRITEMQQAQAKLDRLELVVQEITTWADAAPSDPTPELADTVSATTPNALTTALPAVEPAPSASGPAGST